MSNLKNFQLIIVILFAFGGILGIFVFAGFINLDSSAVNSGPTGTVTLWGTYSADIIRPMLEEVNKDSNVVVKYVRKDQDSFDSDLLEALAIDKGPDLFFLPDDLAFKYINKISVIPFTSYPLVNFKNNFSSAGDVFLNNNGIIAFPVTTDPLMLYYNKTILDSNNVVYPPSYWDELPELVQTFTKKNQNGEIETSAFALGQFSNIANAKDILVSLFMQNGNDIVYLNRNTYRSGLKKEIGVDVDLVKSLDFYLSFSDPLKENYSWNKSLPNSLDAFSKEDLVFYFGFASDLGQLFNKNPNLNFAVTPLPQIRGENSKYTKGKVTGIAISSSTKNFNAAYAAVNSLAGGSFADKLAASLAIPPARRDLLAKKGRDIYTPIFFSSALFSKSFIDPSKKDTDNIFRLMVDQVLSNGYDSLKSLDNTSNRLNLLLFNN